MNGVDLLPDYPAVSDVWNALKNEERPIVVYGMGNGADKLLAKFTEYSVTVADFFASDGFVRGHSYRGVRIKSFSEIKEKYQDFVIVLSFASRRREVIEFLKCLDSDYDMYVPDMPVADTDEYFDCNFYNNHYNEICKAINCLADDESKKLFANIIKYKLSGKLSYLTDLTHSVSDVYSLLLMKDIKNAIDAGAYNGDTAREMLEHLGSVENIIAIEPDKKNFSKLQRYSLAESDVNIKCINAAVWSENGIADFHTSGNRNSTISATASYQHKDSFVETVTVDSVAQFKVDYIKYDVEGAESEALIGSSGIIARDKPALLVSSYHRSRDIFSLVLYLGSEYPFYNLYLRRLLCVPAWELSIIAIPKK